MDLLQIFLVVSLALLTSLFIFLGIHVYYVLVELRHALKILQKTLDNTTEITEMVKSPVSSLTKITGWTSVLSGLREGLKFYKSIKGKGSKESQYD
jgi:uncharacterized protein YoxC